MYAIQVFCPELNIKQHDKELFLNIDDSKKSNILNQVKLIYEIISYILNRENLDIVDRIKAVYKKYAKRLHPDTSRASNNTFEILKGLYEVAKEMRIMMVDNCRKAGINMEY